MEKREFVKLVSEMRNAQKAYFRDRSSTNLTQAKTLERRVDEEIRNIERLETEPVLPFQ